MDLGTNNALVKDSLPTQGLYSMAQVALSSPLFLCLKVGLCTKD